MGPPSATVTLGNESTVNMPTLVKLMPVLSATRQCPAHAAVRATLQATAHALYLAGR